MFAFSISIRCTRRPARKAFVGGVLNPGSGGIHPLNYLHGLAEGLAQPRRRDLPGNALRSGYRRDNGIVVVETPQGAVWARQVIIATNAIPI